MTTSRIAVVGAGYIGKAHIAAAHASTTCTLPAIVDPVPATRKLAADLGVSLYATITELLEEDRPDGTVIATPNDLHVPYALQCITAGLPILLEKPIAPTVSEA